MIPFPDKKYEIIYADPAWQYQNGSVLPQSGLRLEEHGHYGTLSFSEMEALPVSAIADENCLLFLWVISPDLKKCIEVGEAWGFEYKQIAFCWDKQRKVWGNYTFTQVELCLVFKKGSIPSPRGTSNEVQFLSVQRGEHSVKPLQVKARIQRMFPTQSKIELFARPGLLKYTDDGWDYWGNEV